MHRSLMAGMSLMALFAVAGCAQDRAGMASTNASTNAGSGSSGRGCLQGNMDPRCTDASRLGLSGSSGMRGTTDMGLIDDPSFRVPPQNRRTSGNRPGAGMPMEPNSNRPSESPGTLSGDAGKRTTGEPGGN